MEKMKIAVVAVVAVVIVAACAIVLLNNEGKSEEVDINSQLRVFGNADGNYTIDQNDLKVIDDILAGKEDFSDHPLADADNDGKITEDDKTLVQKIINGEKCTVYHYNTCSTGDYIVSTQWPVKSALATGAANMLWLLTMAGVNDMVHGITYSSSSPPDPTLFPTYNKMTSIGSSSTKMPIDNASSYISDYNVTAIISDKTASTIDKDTVEVQYEAMGVDIIRVAPASVDVDEFCSQLFLIGFLFQTEDACKDIAEWWIGLQNEINSKLEGVEKKTAITCNGTATSKGLWVSAGTSDYVDVILAAGGEYALDDKVLTSYASGAYFSSSDTWLYNYDFDYIVSIRTNDWYSGTIDDTEKYESSLGLLSHTEAYENKHAYVITGDAPIPLRIAYASTVLYPEIFSEEWADSLNQEFMDKFTDLNIDISSLHFVISYDMAYGAA